MQKSNTNALLLAESEHSRGNSFCPECFEGAWPRRHERCAGLVHAEYTDECCEGYWLRELCDSCQIDQTIWLARLSLLAPCA